MSAQSSDDFDSDSHEGQAEVNSLTELARRAAVQAATAADQAASKRKEADKLLAETEAAKARAIHLAYRRQQRRSRSNSPTRELKKQRHPKDDAPMGFRRSTCPLGHCCNNPLCYVNIADAQIVWDKSRFQKPYTPKWKRHVKGRKSAAFTQRDKQ